MNVRIITFYDDLEVTNIKFQGSYFKLLVLPIDKVLFRFWGLPVDKNPRRLETWKTRLDFVMKILSWWKGRNLLIGGRVVLINLVHSTSNLPLFYFSFFKASWNVLYKIV